MIYSGKNVTTISTRNAEFALSWQQPGSYHTLKNIQQVRKINVKRKQPENSSEE